MSREFILERIRANTTNGETDDKKRQRTVVARMKSAPSGVLPAQPKATTARVTRFMEKLEKAQASVVMTTVNGLPSAVADWLRAHNLPAEIRVGDDKRLSSLAGDRKSALTIRKGPSDGRDLATVSHAEMGVSETGTLALVSGKENPTTLNFLPENHIVVLKRSDIVAHYEEIWPMLRKRYGKGQMPRTVNLVTGPSRSADIEQTLLLGAHGPVRLHVIIVRD